MPDTNLPTDNPGAAAADNQPSNAGPAGVDAGTGQNTGQAQGATPGDLFKGIDPNKLPPEIRGHYDSMLRDYRDKTSKLSETTKSEIAKATETYRERAEYYDQIVANDEFVSKWNEYVKAKNDQPAGATDGSDPALSKLQNELKNITQKLETSELISVIDAFEKATDDKGQPLHPDFSKLEEFSVGQKSNGISKEEISLLRVSVDLAAGKTPQERLANGYQNAKKLYDAIFDLGRKSGMNRVAAKVMNGTNPPSNIGGNLTTTERKPKNAHEAMEMARKGIMVSR